MRNYEIYKNEDTERFIIVFIFNERDMLFVQKQIIEMGYIITQRINGNYFRAYKPEEELE